MDSQQRDNFEYFLRYGVEEQDWLRYRLVVASGVGVLVRARCLGLVCCRGEMVSSGAVGC